MRTKTKVIVIAVKNGKRFGHALLVPNQNYLEDWLKSKGFEYVESAKIKVIE